MWRIVQHETPEDFVLATGKTVSVREFVELAFAEADIKIAWKDKGVDEIGFDTKTNKAIVEIDPRYFRPTEVDLLIGDPSKAKRLLGWEAKTSLQQMVKEMMAADLSLVKREADYRRVDEEIMRSKK